MAVRVIQLGSPRRRGEGVRIGTVRRPPRGVPKSQYARLDFFDVWYPVLSPSAKLMQSILRLPAGRDPDQAWRNFARRFKTEMDRPEPSRTLDVLAALSHSANFSIGCYCQDENRCHRGILRQLLKERGGKLI
jgi:uncharacterized protein YeaO (DUF488 family)